MTRLVLILVALCIMVSAPVTHAEDKIVGAAWEIKILRKGKSPALVYFRATPDGKVFNRTAEVIGSWKGDNENAEMDINGIKGARSGLNGTYVLTNISKGPTPRWQGKWTPQGTTRALPVSVRLLKD